MSLGYLAIQKGDPRAALQHADQALQLDESQSQQLEAIMSDAREQHESLAREDHEAHCAIKAGVDLQIVELLNAEQLTSFEEMRSERASRPDNRKGPGPLDCE